MKPVTVCGTTHSAVVVCNQPGCDTREVGTTRGVVLRAAVAHYEVAHPNQVRAAQQLRRRASSLVESRRDTPAP